MHSLKKILAAVGLIILFGVAAAQAEHNQDLDNKAALKGLDTVRVVVDLNAGSAKLLLFRIKMIEYTRQNIIDEGKKTDFVVAVRGGATRFMTESDAYIDAGDKKVKAEITERLKGLMKAGIPIEQCAVAADAQGVDTNDLLEGISLVRNGYVSIVGYQNRGYALLPMD